MDCRAHDAGGRGSVRRGRGDGLAPIAEARRTHRRSPRQPRRHLELAGPLAHPASDTEDPSTSAASAAGDPLIAAAELVARTAVLIPVPGETLARDDASWSGFEALVAEAAGLLADRLGRDARTTLCALIASPLSDDPLCLLLIEQALGKLTAHRL